MSAPGVTAAERERYEARLRESAEVRDRWVRYARALLEALPEPLGVREADVRVERRYGGGEVGGLHLHAPAPETLAALRAFRGGAVVHLWAAPDRELPDGPQEGEEP